MKAKSINAADAEATTNFNAAIAAIHSSIGSNELITDKDKKGGKMSDKELAETAFAIENLSKVAHKLPRDFKEDDFIMQCQDIDEVEAQRDQFQILLDYSNAKLTTKRVALKPMFKVVYTAAQDAANDNPALRYIPERLSKAYARTNTTSETTAKMRGKGKIKDEPV